MKNILIAKLLQIVLAKLAKFIMPTQTYYAYSIYIYTIYDLGSVVILHLSTF